MAAEKYTISVPDEDLARLKEKLSAAVFPDELSELDNPWQQGSPLNDVKRLTEYWLNGFDWRKAEAELNALPNYHTRLNINNFGELDIHFLHQPSNVEGAIPLLFCHGWPGSYLEVKKILPMLSGSRDTPAFHVVAPSLPNYGWSEGVKKKGFSGAQYAETCHKLMLSLGYDEYVTQGGDWGYYVTRAMGFLYPKHCKASHLNMVRSKPPKFSKNPWQALQHAVKPYSQAEVDGLKRTEWFNKEGKAYNQLQATRPQTIGYALRDSPVALLAWQWEKMHDWTDSYPWTDDEILTWISMYWFSRAGPHAAVRIYWESTHTTSNGIGAFGMPQRDMLEGWIPGVKLGLAFFPKELTVPPATWARTMGPVVYESYHKQGGHFAAWENPSVIVADLQNMFGKGGPCYEIVKGKTGYNAAPKARL